MPRVIPNQKERFDKDELFKKLTQDSEVKYSAYRDLQHEERKRNLSNLSKKAILVFLSLTQVVIFLFNFVKMHGLKIRKIASPLRSLLIFPGTMEKLVYMLF